jgi:hypothetical protein
VYLVKGDAFAVAAGFAAGLAAGVVFFAAD